jgi:hypothetical protein
VTNESITYLVAACCGVFGLAAYAAFILVPAWNSYSRVWERLVAAFLSLYALVTFLVVGVVAGLAVVWFWDRFTG